jgi:hypothetical protein
VKRRVLLVVTLGALVAGLAVIQMGKLDVLVKSIIFIVLGALLLVISLVYKKEREKMRGYL